MIRMSVRYDRPINLAPRINVEIAGGTIDPLFRNRQQFGHFVCSTRFTL